MKLLSTFIASSLQLADDQIPTGLHENNCLFPSADYKHSTGARGIFNDPFSQFTFTGDAVSSDEWGDYYALGATAVRTCATEGSCSVNTDGSMACDFSNGSILTYPCAFNDLREFYGFVDGNQEGATDRPRSAFFRGGKWDKYKPANRPATLCPGFGKKKVVPATDGVAMCGAKPMVPENKEEWAEVDNRVASSSRDCTIWNAEGTSTSCAVGCKWKAKNPKTLNLACAQKKFGKGDFKWWSIENGKFKPAGKRLLKASYWCIPDKDYVPEDSGEGSGEASGEGSGSIEIDNADVSM